MSQPSRSTRRVIVRRAVQAPTALFAALAKAATVGGALVFQHWGGYIPCKLCYEGRLPHYFGIPVMIAAFGAAAFRAPQWLTRGLLAVGGLLMLWGTTISGFHAGVEWGWWPGPNDCGAVSGGTVDTGGQGVLDALDQVVPPSCDQAALRILGLSLAGWNFLICLGLAGLSFWAASKKE